MIIYTDDQKYASKILPDIKSWELINYKNISSDISFIKKIFHHQELYFSEIRYSAFWQYLFISKYSEQSQFDLLYHLSKINPELPDGILCIADSGTKFHGYRNRHWKAQPGNLHLSIFKKPNKPVKDFHIGFTILAAISVVQTLDNITGLEGKAGIKWVNDIIVDDAKISGVITQTQSQQDAVTAVVLGVGLNIEKAPNISPDNFVNKTTCLFDKSEKNKINFSNIFFDLIKNTEINYQKLLTGNYQSLLNFYRNKSVIINRQVEIFSDSRNGENSLIASGKITKIGDELELYIEGIENPIRQGRLKLL
jgi:biotin-[acetyl-CoA-carboxylase] ligase BirA-like protein